MRFIWYFDKKALSSQCERKKGDIFKSYPFTGATVNAPKRVVKCWDKKRAYILIICKLSGVESNVVHYNRYWLQKYFIIFFPANILPFI